MENVKEIQSRMNSIRDTMKITGAMYMMSSMKLRRAKRQLEDTEPYFYGLKEELTDILYHFPDMKSHYFYNRRRSNPDGEKKVGYVVITGDKGMAGSYNHNVIKKAMEACRSEGSISVYAVGRIGRRYFAGQGLETAEDFTFSASNPSIHRARGIAEYMMELYEKEELDEVYVIYTRMVNAMREDVEIEQILPLKSHSLLEKELGDKQEQEAYQIYPSPKAVLEKLVYHYVTGFLYGVLVESYACEENARMMAMRSATDNAQEMLKALSVQYNRVRQAAITQEITEVVGGARASRKKRKKPEREVSNGREYR